MSEQTAATIYVSTTGNDAAAGTAEHPLATLAGARDAIRRIVGRSGTPPGGTAPGGITVLVSGGTYVMDGSFALSSADSGSPDAPIVYRACDGDTVRLLGGRVVDNLGPVGDPAILARLAPAARSHVLQADLRSLGIADFGRLASRGFGRKSVPAHCELFFNGRPMTLAQWPNAGQFATITGFTVAMADEWQQQTGKLDGGFTYDGDRPKGWAPSDDIWVHGYWSWDWANSYEHIRTLNVERRIVETHPPHGNYSFRKGQRFYFLNILEELDEPGEYYVDTKAGLLYFWPPEDPARAEVIVSVLEAPLLNLQDASHVMLRGLTIECGRGCGIKLTGGTGVAIAGCTVRNTGTWGIEAAGGSGHRITGCNVYGNGDGGIKLDAGDRKTLTAANCEITNNHIHHIGRWSRSYQAGVLASGVGIRIANNLIHDGPHNAILYWGNDIAVEFNEIYRVCMESGDVGAIYTGRDYTYRGNCVRGNYIHNLGGVGMGCSAIYMDDCVSGHEIRDNIVWGSDGIWLGSGRDFIIENNIFIDCPRCIAYDSRGSDPNPVWRNMVLRTMKDRLDQMNYLQPPFITRYPLLATLEALYAAGGGVPCGNNRVARNISFGGQWLSKWGNVDESVLGLADNLVGADPQFADRSAGNYRLRPGSPALALGFEQIAEERIGLVADAFRPLLPPKVVTLLEVLETTQGKVKVRLVARNVGAKRAAGRVNLHVAAAQPAATGGAAELSFDLEPGARIEKEFMVDVPALPATIDAVPSGDGVRPARLRLAAR